MSGMRRLRVTHTPTFPYKVKVGVETPTRRGVSLSYGAYSTAMRSPITAKYGIATFGLQRIGQTPPVNRLMFLLMSHPAPAPRAAPNEGRSTGACTSQ